MPLMPHLYDTILRHIEGLGFDVWVDRQGGKTTFTATGRDGQMYIVTADFGDEYRAVCELAGMVGIILDDG